MTEAATNGYTAAAAAKHPPAGLLLGVTAAIVLVAAGVFLPLKSYLVTLLEWTAGLGMWGPIFVGGIYVPACVLMIPGSILTLGAGALFGVVRGMIAVSLGSTLGACMAFVIGRYLARDWVAGKAAQNARFKAIDAAVGQHGFRIVILTRLSPVFPFNLLNYMYGLTQVRLRDYALASWIGMLPGTIMYVYLGSAAGSLAKAAAGQLERSAGQEVLFWVGMVATVVVTVLVTRVARRALTAAVPEAATGGEQ